MAKQSVRRKKRKRRGSFGRSVVLLVTAALLVVGLLVGVSACRRRKAVAQALWDGSWYADELGRLESEKELLSGMKAFEKRTGERPYLILLGGVAPETLDADAQARYEALFADRGHVLVMYDEWGDGLYYLACQTGPDSPLTEADADTLLDCLERAYADGRNGSYGAAFGAGFREAAGLMSARRETHGAAVTLLILAAVLVLLGVVLLSILRRNARRARRWMEDEG